MEIADQRLAAERLFFGRVGDVDDVPKVATPEIVTAGPTGSDGSAFRSLNIN